MPSYDPSGIAREGLISKSKIRTVFTPHTPVQATSLFFGRKREVNALIEQINTPGQHALLYGDRGVGKSSLAKLVARMLVDNFIHGNVHYDKLCSHDDTFPTILEEPLRMFGHDVFVEGEETSTEFGGGGGVNAKIVSASLNARRSETRRFSGVYSRALSPGWVAELLRDHPGLLVVDEADAIQDPLDKKRLAELIKHLSDRNSLFKILLVGVAETGAFLTGGHPSVQRCLRETRLDRMSEPELTGIITGGARRCGLEFKKEVVTRIVGLSAGYPHFAHLLALKCAEEAVTDGRRSIGVRDLAPAMKSAVQDAEGTLKRQFDEAVRSPLTDMYWKVVSAAASCENLEFGASDLRNAIQRRYGLCVTQNRLNNYFQRLVSDSGSTILQRIAKGVYKFSDPRMPSYVKIAGAEFNGKDEELC